jgi:RimJ/RimL family protein N-acetyltransferase
MVRDPLATLRAGVYLRPHVTENVSQVHAWYNDPEIQLMSAGSTGAVPFEKNRERLDRWMTPAGDQLHFAIHRSVDARLVGFLHLVDIDSEHKACKVGLVIGERECWGLGYGTGALKMACEYAFRELSMFRVSAEAYADNPRSIRMLERAGFVREGVQRAAIRRAASRTDVYTYAILRTD